MRKIEAEFSEEEVNSNLGDVSAPTEQRVREQAMVKKPRYMLKEHPGFEVVKFPSGQELVKAYNKYFDVEMSDLDIELHFIGKFEKMLQMKMEEPEGTSGASMKSREKKEALQAIKKRLKFHYKKAVVLISGRYSAGWNRWSDKILDLFIDEKLYKVLWGSGNCGKSAIMGLLLYVKWRVNPQGRKIILASKVTTEADTRVWSYILEIHSNSPATKLCKFKTDENKNPGIYALFYDKKSGKYIRNKRGCIALLPVKPKEKSENIGENLIGHHPSERLIVCFDEAQELMATFLESKAFSNWMTNHNKDIYAWGNPTQVSYHMKETWDLLFKLGVRGISFDKLVKFSKEAKKTGGWRWGDTEVLRFTMLDSPKDDDDEKAWAEKERKAGRSHRLVFLAGIEESREIEKNSFPNTPGYWSQVLGFPFVENELGDSKGVLTPYIVRESRMYPLVWKGGDEPVYWMGVDPSGSGRNDTTSIIVGREGMMMDGRIGVDYMNGEGLREIQKTEGKEFIDDVIENMWELSRMYKIPLSRISIETHSVGETLRYAIGRHIHDEGKWKEDSDRGENFHTFNPSAGVSDRLLFKTMGKMKPAKEICQNAVTEFWVAMRCAVISRQVFNLPQEVLEQMYSRQLIESNTTRKYRIETKDEMKKRGVRSPNSADAAVIMFEGIRARGRFGYRFVDKPGYKNKYGEEYRDAIDEKTAKQRISLVGKMFGIEERLMTHSGFGNPDKTLGIIRVSGKVEPV